MRNSQVDRRDSMLDDKEKKDEVDIVNNENYWDEDTPFGPVDDKDQKEKEEKEKKEKEEKEKAEAERKAKQEEEEAKKKD